MIYQVCVILSHLSRYTITLPFSWWLASCYAGHCHLSLQQHWLPRNVADPSLWLPKQVIDIISIVCPCSSIDCPGMSLSLLLSDLWQPRLLLLLLSVPAAVLAAQECCCHHCHVTLLLHRRSSLSLSLPSSRWLSREVVIAVVVIERWWSAQGRSSLGRREGDL